MTTIDRIIRMPEVEKTVGLKKSSIYSMVKDGKFPKPVKISQGAKGWFESEVQAWITKKKTAHEPANDSQPQAA